ncbi:MAG: PilZ domain-containing protein [Acidobacteria bacterium]|nr:PilZ domain-containing protein [Acidobacteriota bacterium]
MRQARDALLVTHGGPLLDPIVPLLRRSSFTIHRAPAEAASIELMQTSPFDLIVIEYPIEGSSMNAIVSAVRAPESASRNAGLMVVADDTGTAAVEPLVGGGINRIVRRSHVGSEFLMALADLLAVEPRRPLRAVIRVKVMASSNTSNMILAQTENLSASGMLVRGSVRHFPVGSEIDFQLVLPGAQEPVRGRAQVVRHAQWRRERIEGFGVRFTNLSPNAAVRIKNLLEGSD